MLSAVFAAGMGGQIDPLAAVNYLNQMGNYQDILRQYQSNLSSMTNLAAAGFGNIATSLPSSVSSSVPTMGSVTSPTGLPSPSGNLGNLGGMSNLSSLTVQQLLNLSNNSNAGSSRAGQMYPQAGTKPATSTSTTKDVPSVSITPVGCNMQQQQPIKTKMPKHSSSSSSHNEPMPAHMTKAMPIAQTSTKTTTHPTTTQVSLLKPSVVAQTKNPPPKQMSAPQIRVSKSLTEPQPAHNSSHSSLTSGNSSGPTGNVLQAAHSVLQAPNSISIKPTSSNMGMPTSRNSTTTGGTSLQHKLLSKKMAQQALQPIPVKSQNMPKKQKTSKNIPQLPNNLQSLLSSMSGASAHPMGQPSFLPQELSGISVSPVGPSVTKPPPPPKHPPYRKVSKNPKSANMEMSGAIQPSLPTPNSADTLSMLSQLQQHSHLEIIPQQKSLAKPNQIDYSKNLPLSLSIVPPQKIVENSRPTTSECMSVYELPRTKTNPNSNKKNESKHVKDSVEIITLDD